MKGLSQNEALARLNQYGPNELIEKKESSALTVFVSQFSSPLIFVLILAGLITFWLKEYGDAAVIFGAVIINTLFGFYQEWRAQKTFSSLKKYLGFKVKVIRDGKQLLIEARKIVPGDLIFLTIGDRIPADGYVVEATDLTVSEAILTGESLPVGKKIKSLVFGGTNIVAGIGKMVVEKTGKQTKIGQIDQSLSDFGQKKHTPLSLEIAKIAKNMTVMIGFLAVIIFLLGWYFGYPPLVMLTTSVAVAVAAIPEGLAVSFTVILALGMRRMLKRKALVKKLISAETLGSVTVVCLDKTGTLTEGDLRVVKDDFTDRALGIKAAVLCNDMRDPLEVAMMKWALRQPQGKGANKITRFDEIPFSPKTKIIATLHPDLLLVSGAPEVVLGKCKIKNEELILWKDKFRDYGEKGNRIVAFAYREVANSKLKIENSDLKDLTWLGILAYEDPVRAGVGEAIKEFIKEGLKIKVITGDYLPTSLAVLKKIGLDKVEAMTGEDLKKLGPDELKKKISQCLLFARVDPFEKLKIVEVLKKQGEVVAMMGDAVNDAPALAKADIGIVVGNASDVARETADMILLDSNFHSILFAIKEGRLIFGNLKKIIIFLLSHSFSEIILIGGSLILGLPLPITAAQILWINLFQDSFPAVALAFDKDNFGSLTVKNSIMTGPLKRFIGLYSLGSSLILLVMAWLTGNSTIVFAALGINSLLSIFALRTNFLANKYLSLAVGASLLSILLAIYWPPLMILMKTTNLSLSSWFLIAIVGLLNLGLVRLCQHGFSY